MSHTPRANQFDSLVSEGGGQLSAKALKVKTKSPACRLRETAPPKATPLKTQVKIVQMWRLGASALQMQEAGIEIEHIIRIGNDLGLDVSELLTNGELQEEALKLELKERVKVCQTPQINVEDKGTAASEVTSEVVSEVVPEVIPEVVPDSGIPESDATTQALGTLGISNLEEARATRSASKRTGASHKSVLARVRKLRDKALRNSELRNNEPHSNELNNKDPEMPQVKGDLRLIYSGEGLDARERSILEDSELSWEEQGIAPKKTSNKVESNADLAALVESFKKQEAESRNRQVKATSSKAKPSKSNSPKLELPPKKKGRLPTELALARPTSKEPGVSEVRAQEFSPAQKDSILDLIANQETLLELATRHRNRKAANQKAKKEEKDLLKGKGEFLFAVLDQLRATVCPECSAKFLILASMAYVRCTACRHSFSMG